MNGKLYNNTSNLQIKHNNSPGTFQIKQTIPTIQIVLITQPT